MKHQIQAKDEVRLEVRLEFVSDTLIFSVFLTASQSRDAAAAVHDGADLPL